MYFQGIDIFDLSKKFVVSVKPTATIEEAIYILNDYSYRGLPVLSESKMVGIITAQNIIHGFYKNPDSTLFEMPVSKYMQTSFQLLQSNHTIKYALEALVKSQETANMLPVMKNDKLTGMLTPTDIIAANFLWVNTKDRAITTVNGKLRIGRDITTIEKISEDQPLYQLFELFEHTNSNHTLICEPTTQIVKGIISSKELIHYLCSHVEDLEDDFQYFHSTPLFQIEPNPAYYFKLPALLSEVRSFMSIHENSASVLLDEGVPIGLLTNQDLLEYLYLQSLHEHNDSKTT